MNKFSQYLLKQSQVYAAMSLDYPEGALIAAVLNMLATSTPKELAEIYEHLEKRGVSTP